MSTSATNPDLAKISPERIKKLIDFFEHRDPTSFISNKEIESKTGIPYPQVSQVTKTLSQVGYLKRKSGQGSYYEQRTNFYAREEENPFVGRSIEKVVAELRPASDETPMEDVFNIIKSSPSPTSKEDLETKFGRSSSLLVARLISRGRVVTNSAQNRFIDTPRRAVFGPNARGADQYETVTDKVLRVLKAAKTPLSLTDIAERTGVGYSSIGTTIRSLIEKQKVANLGSTYVLSSEPQLLNVNRVATRYTRGELKATLTRFLKENGPSTFETIVSKLGRSGDENTDQRRFYSALYREKDIHFKYGRYFLTEQEHEVEEYAPKVHAPVQQPTPVAQPSAHQEPTHKAAPENILKLTEQFEGYLKNVKDEVDTMILNITEEIEGMTKPDLTKASTEALLAEIGRRMASK